VKKALAKAKENERNTCKSEDNMKTMLVKMKAIKNDSREHESDTYEIKGEQKQ